MATRSRREVANLQLAQLLQTGLSLTKKLDNKLTRRTGTRWRDMAPRHFEGEELAARERAREPK